MTPDVRCQLHRAAASAIDAVGSVVATVGHLCSAAETWLEQRSAVFTARADVDDADELEALDIEEDR